VIQTVGRKEGKVLAIESVIRPSSEGSRTEKADNDDEERERERERVGAVERRQGGASSGDESPALDSVPPVSAHVTAASLLEGSSGSGVGGGAMVCTQKADAEDDAEQESRVEAQTEVDAEMGEADDVGTDPGDEPDAELAKTAKGKLASKLGGPPLGKDEEQAQRAARLSRHTAGRMSCMEADEEGASSSS